MSHLLHLMFRCDGDVMKSDIFVRFFGGSKHTVCGEVIKRIVPELFVSVKRLWLVRLASLSY